VVYVVDAFPGTAALLPVLGAAAVIAGGAAGTGARHLLGLRPVRSVGRVSFGWYLLHYPPMIILTGALWTHRLSVQENLLIAAATLVGPTHVRRRRTADPALALSCLPSMAKHFDGGAL